MLFPVFTIFECVLDFPLQVERQKPNSIIAYDRQNYPNIAVIGIIILPNCPLQIH